MHDFCIANNICICTVRVGKDKNIGKVTCVKGNRFVDCFVCSPAIIANIFKFVVDEYNSMLSDVHCAISYICAWSYKCE